LKLNSGGGDSDVKRYKQGYGGVWQSMCLTGAWSKAVGFVLVCLASVVMKIFSHLI
jgi:hypothetical protein